VTAVQPLLVSEIDWTGNPTAGYYDQLRNASGLVSYWRMNDAGTFADALGANNGTIVATPSLVAGALANDTDQALSFNGSSQHAYVPDAPSLSPATFSLSGWVKLAAYPGATGDLVAKRGSYMLQVTSTGTLQFSLKNDTTVVTVTSGTPISIGAWHHVACVFDGTNILIYIDGVVDRGAATTGAYDTTTQPLRFAANAATTAPTWQSSVTNGGLTATTLTINAPASIASGDLLVAQIAVSAVTPVTPPSGWTLVPGNGGTISSSSGTSRIYVKVATGSEPASYTWTPDTSVNWAGSISRITGVDPLTPIANGCYGTAQNSGTSHPTGSHMPNVDNSLILAFFHVAGTSVTFTEDSGTERYERTANQSIAMCSQSMASAAAIGVTGTASGGNFGEAQLLVIGGSGLNFTAAALDEFTFWSVALTAEQIAEHYEARLGGVGAWTDVSTDVKSLETSAGRQYELDRMEASTSSAVLDDVARNYDPANGSSIYSPNVIPLRRIRHRLDLSGTKYPISRGFIERYPQEWEGDYEQITLQAEDGFEQLALAGVSGTLPSGLTGAQINKLLDLAAWPIADRAIDPGAFVMAAQTLDGDALSAIATLADSELGIFFIDAAGVATFHDFNHRRTATRSKTSQATFSNAADSFPYYSNLQPSFDKDKIVNAWEVVTASGVSRVAARPVVDQPLLPTLRNTLHTARRPGRCANTRDRAPPGNRDASVALRRLDDRAFRFVELDNHPRARDLRPHHRHPRPRAWRRRPDDHQRRLRRGISMAAERRRHVQPDAPAQSLLAGRLLPHDPP
jgi:hypothetical protein